jgi:hypothetical protein
MVARRLPPERWPRVLRWGLGGSGALFAFALGTRLLRHSDATVSSLAGSLPESSEAASSATSAGHQSQVRQALTPGPIGEPGPKAAPEPAAAPAATAPEAITPPFRNVAAAGDGEWTSVVDPDRPAAEALMYRTTLHPDPGNPRAELFLVTMPVQSVELHAVAGTLEPHTTNPEAAKIESRGIIPETDQTDLLAGFNGGFRAEHGHHGMMVQGIVLIPPVADRCTIYGYADGTIQIRSFHPEPPGAPEPAWYRQTSRCLVEQGNVNPALQQNPRTTAWGAALGGETSIRRSALGLTRDGTRLLVAVSDFTTAKAIAVGMQSAGGWNVAQLDVNWSFPKFMLFPRDANGRRFGAPLFSGFTTKPEDMVQKPSTRDFFYLLRRHRHS